MTPSQDNIAKLAGSIASINTLFSLARQGSEEIQMPSGPGASEI